MRALRVLVPALWLGAAPVAEAATVAVSPPGYRLPIERITFGPAESDACLRCHGLPNFMVRDSTGRIRRLSLDAAAFRRTAHRAIACTHCHPEIRVWPHELAAGRRPVGCDAGCHARDSTGAAIRHDRPMADLRASAHRGGLTGEDPASPVCTDCHGAGDPHAIERAKDALSPGQKMAWCAPCHEDRQRLARSEVSLDAVATYRESFHYKAIRHGSTRAAVCQDCHAVHRVIAHADTASTVNAIHLPRTCGQEDCHRGARMSFAMSGANHLGLRVRRDPVLAGVGALFVRGGLLVIALLAVGVGLDARRRAGERARARARGVRVAAAPGALIERLSPAVRIQHLLLVVSFVALAGTGLPLRYPDLAPLAVFYRALGGLDVARVAHRVAGVVLVLTALAHLLYAATLLVRARFDVARAWPLLPGRPDVREWWQATLHDLGLRPDPPAFGRHRFREKIHYCAVAWGVPVMAVSGLLLWFPVFFGNRLPDAAIGAALIAHGDEALLAVAVVLVWHLYQVHVAPRPHHRFGTWLDGKVTDAYVAAEHPREARRLAGVAEMPPATAPQPATGRAPGEVGA